MGDHALDPRLLEILACPACIGTFELRGDHLHCSRCPRVYRVDDGIPVLLIEEAEIDTELASRASRSGIIKPRSGATEPPSGLAATYFPWSVISDQHTLKRALLYFDRVHLISPPPDAVERAIRIPVNAAGGERGDVRKIRNILERFHSLVSTLRREGAVKTFDSSSILQDASLRAQLVDLTFADAVNLDDLVLRQDIEYYWGNCAPGDVRIARETDKASNRISLHYWVDLETNELVREVESKVDDYMHRLPGAARKLFLRESVYDKIVPALLHNISLMCVEHIGVPPLIDNAPDFNLLRNKYHRMLDADLNTHSAENWEALKRYVARTNTKSGVLANYALELLLPDLDCLSFDDILHLRAQFTESLQHFRLKMAQLTHEITSTVADSEFYKECQKVIEKELLPSILELQKQVELSRSRAIRRLLDKIGSFKPAVPFVVSSFSPLPLHAAALVSAGIVTLDFALDSFIESKARTHNNGVAYVLNVSPVDLRVDDTFWARSSMLEARYLNLE